MTSLTGRERPSEERASKAADAAVEETREQDPTQTPEGDDMTPRQEEDGAEETPEVQEETSDAEEEAPAAESPEEAKA